MQRKSKVRNLLVLLLILMVIMSGCATGEKEKAVPEKDQNSTKPGTIAVGYLEEISDKTPRIAGTEAEAATGDWIQAALEEMGYTVTTEPFHYEEDGMKGKSENIIAVKPGNSEETVVLGAHYDSVDIGHGVDDNGSGVAVVLETAKQLKDVETPQTIKFVFFGAEEIGLCGSEYHVSQMAPEDIENTVLMMNYDSLVAGDNSYVYGNSDEKGKFRDLALEIAEQNQLDLVTQPGENKEYPAGTTGDWSDHAAFKEAGIPFLYFESTDWSLGEKDGYTQVALTLGSDGEIWHTEYDTIDYINEKFPGRINDKMATFTTVTEKLLMKDLSSF